MKENEISGKIIGAAIEVHKQLGPGLLESAYEECLAHEMRLQNILYERQKPLPLTYKGVQPDCGYRLDFLVENIVVVELKTVSTFTPIHKAQIITYLKLTQCKLDLLLNFHTSILKNGFKRIVLNL